MKELRTTVTSSEKKSLEHFKELVIEKNKLMNLTAIAPQDFESRHFVDSLKLLDFVELRGRVLDLGTGAGFPGIPLAILLEEVDFVLMDSLRKRINFLEEVKEELGLENISLLHARAEEAARKDYREAFDFVVTRALAPLPLLIEYTLPFLKLGGSLYAYKGRKLQEEVDQSSRALKELGGELGEVYDYSLDGEERRILTVKKVKTTPKKYPRRPGLASREPLV